MKKAIQWEKFKDPFIPADMAEDFEFENDTETFNKETFDVSGRPRVNPYKGPFMFGPYGLFPLGEHNLPSKRYNLWVAHANFDVTPDVVRAVERVDGVEVLKVWSRYRFWVGFGKMFDQKAVQEAVELAACPPPPVVRLKSPARRRLDILAGFLAAKYRHWAVYRAGKLVQCDGGDDESEVRRRTGKSPVLAASWRKHD